jgi:hypothetical protein
MDSTPQSKHTVWQTVLKRMIWQTIIYETHLIDRNKYWLYVKDWKKIYQANGPPKVVILISDKVGFELTLVKWDKEGYFILIKGAIHQKEIKIINLYAPSVSTPNFIKHTLKDLKAHKDSNTVVVGDFNTALSPINRPSKQNIDKKILELNDTIIQIDLMSIEYFIQQQHNMHSFQQLWNFLQNRSYNRTQSNPHQI